MRNQFKAPVATLILAVIVFAAGCPMAPPDTGGTQNGTPVAVPTEPEVAGPAKCDINGINDWIGDRIKNAGGPLKSQFDGGSFVMKAVPVTLKTTNEKGEEQEATYAQLVISKVLTDHDDKSTPKLAPTLPQLNAIIQPLVKWNANSGPCVTSVKYITEATADAPASEDFMWSYCPVGSQVCSDGTCSQYCKDGTGGIGR